MAKARIMVVDDEPGMLEVCGEILQKISDAEICLECESLRAAERIEVESPDLLVADVRMPGLTGLQLLQRARQHDPNIAVLMLTAYPAVDTAVESMKLGAADYISKPFVPQELLAAAKRLLEDKRLKDENRLLRRQVERSYAFGEIIGQSSVMLDVFEKIQRVAEINVDVMIVGETGTGKELVARAIHQRSNRNTGAFVPVDGGAIPDELMESEFFGHERGAYTGAQTRSMGLLEFAHKGTFFLDEIGQLPLRLQAKLLRVLQERKIRRVGGIKEIELDLRIIAASSLNLEEEVRKHRFRLDLYHRIHVVSIELPPLCQRGDDIPLIVDHFLTRYAREIDREPAQMSPEVMEILMRYPWPGNVRELLNVLKRTLAMVRHTTITVDDLPDDIVARAGDTCCTSERHFFALRERRMASFEKEYLRNLLTSNHGDIPATVRESQLPRGTLYRLLKKHGLNPSDFRSGQEDQIST